MGGPHKRSTGFGLFQSGETSNEGINQTANP